MSLRIAVAGITGRMGREVVAAATDMPHVIVAGGFVRANDAIPGDGWYRHLKGSVRIATLTAKPSLLADADVLIDFTTSEAATSYARACAEAGVPFVSGTTGLTDADLGELAAAAERVPVFHARNMCLGVATLLNALPAITAALSGFDVEIVETHHRHKMDAPSGTALALAEAVAAGRDIALDDHATFGRRGIAPRLTGEIGLHAVRAGGNPGEHQIIFASDGEEVRLSHRSFSRRAYAQGALRAATFIAGRAPGLYGVQDLLRT